MTAETERRGRNFVVAMRREAKRNAINADITAGIDGAINELEDGGPPGRAKCAANPCDFAGRGQPLDCPLIAGKVVRRPPTGSPSSR